jgi:hypothetical protein
MRARRLLVIAPFVVVATGCGHGRDRPVTASDLRRVTPAEWKSVIRDSYDGHMDHPHSCAAVEVAIAHLPTGLVYSSEPAFLKAYARKVC